MEGSLEQELPDAAVVVRGGSSPTEAMKASVARTLEMRRLQGESDQWLLSVFTHPTRRADEIARRAPILKQWSKIRETTVGELRAFGFEISTPADDGHASLRLPDHPADADYERLQDAFGPARPNPAKLGDTETR